MAQTLEVRGEIQGTHHFSILIKQSNETVLANINETQNSFRVLVPGTTLTHHSPSCHCQLGLPHQGGWDAGPWVPGAVALP